MFLKKFFVFSILFFVLIFLHLPSNVWAMPFGSKVGGIEYELSPSDPGPNETVTIRIKSYSFNVYSSDIIYYVDGKQVASGTGLVEFKTKTKGVGEPTYVKVVAKSFKGLPFQKDIVLTPLDVDIVYESIGAYKPKFYKGKAYALSNSKLKFVAFPNFKTPSGKKIDPDSLIYRWYVDGKIQRYASGYGKRVFILDNLKAYPAETRVRVSVRNLKGDMETLKEILVSPEKAKIDFYIENPAFPFLFKKAANPNLYSNTLETQVRAVPFFLRDFDKKGAFDYTWKINNKIYKHKKDEDQNYLILLNRKVNPIRKANLTLELNPRLNEAFFQASKRRVNIYFSEALDETYFDRDYFRKEESGKKKGFFGLF